jgi:type I restriction-modification system DNA methylase subunit
MKKNVKSLSYDELKNEFISKLKTIDQSKRLYEVFQDFVFFSAAFLRNSVGQLDSSFMDMNIENEYIKRMKSYESLKSRQAFGELLNLLVEMHTTKQLPFDLLGAVYMELEIANQHLGQYYTPSAISDVMANMALQGFQSTVSKQGFVSLSDHACGSGATLLSCVKLFIENNFRVENTLYIEATDIDRHAALMCYVQLSLWAVPCKIYVGNSLTMEMRETWCSFMFYMKGWKLKLNRFMLQQRSISGENYVPNFILIDS